MIRYPVHRKNRLNSLKGKMIRKFWKCMNCVLIYLLGMINKLYMNVYEMNMFIVLHWSLKKVKKHCLEKLHDLN